ncbi:uncharacterized protein LOC131307305 isoform X2 [Rhododendron vialii]|uniref:uncharacterized protein LOC131307305 isoform X2 n=1 Tax=Rhododendron vialii TaxID=182163 RepID=UPI00265DE435|nr:uncharacterized protein LOC131307305 isoform X2 [Rhododendron vialii]
MDPPEPPECPVCLQPYDAPTTTPRVLSCGHSACETCLTHLPRPFPHTIRCPACTQLVKFSNLTSLPKNIDLLRLSSSLLQYPLPQNPPNPQNQTEKNVNFVPSLWSHEFYVIWKDWIIPEGDVAIGFRSDEGLCWVSRIRCSMKGDEEVSLVRVGGGCFVSDPKLKYSYCWEILRVLYGMKDGERDELGMILKASRSKHCRTCKVYGLWYNRDDQGVYMVCERYAGSFVERFGDWKNGFVGEHGSRGLLESKSFAMIAMEMCETLSSLHAEGLFSGCLAIMCFSFDHFGHIHIDLNEAVVMSRRIRMLISEAILGVRKGEEFKLSFRNDTLETLAFVSPELLFELQQKNATDLECGSKFEVGYVSDVWSLACVLLWLLMGKPFTELMCNYLQCFVPMPIDGKDFDYSGIYTSWMEEVKASLETKLVLEFAALQEMLCRCLSIDPGSRPSVIDVWKCIRELVIEPKKDIMVSSVQVVNKNKGHCLFLGELCQLQKESGKMPERRIANGLHDKNDDGSANLDQFAKVRVERDIVEGLSGGHVKSIDLKGHLDCITGLTVGGVFLFSSSFDKTVRVWSLQDFTHVHTFVGHEHKVMAIVFVDDELPLCISGDSGGGIYIWCVCNPFGQEPIKKLFEEKDWRYSGIHALAISGTGYLYTGSGDKSIKAWSLQIWRNDVLIKCKQAHKGAIFAVGMEGKWLFTGGWDKVVNVQELIGDEFQIDAMDLGSISCDSVITALLYWQGKLFVGRADRVTKVYYCGL